VKVYAEDHEILLTAPCILPATSSLEGVEISEELYDQYHEALARVYEVQERLKEAGLNG
jgi:hypothetical protein